MPELPEVETIRRQLEPRLTGRLVTEAGSHPSGKFTPAREVTGARITGTRRRGKYLLLATGDGRELIVHLGMTGSLTLASEPDLDDPYLRAWWQLDTTGRAAAPQPAETLLFTDVRRFGRIRVVPAGDYRTIGGLAAAGPEPFDPAFDGRQFWRLLQRSRRKLKTQLLSQRPIAGVGNIYADEALWLAGINPRATRLSQARAASLLDAIRHVLSQGIDNGGTTLRDYRDLDGGRGDNQRALAAYGRRGQPCLRCGELLRSAVIDARTTTWCPGCQRY